MAITDPTSHWYFYVTLEGGFVRCGFNVGRGPEQLTMPDSVRVDDGAWHQVTPIFFLNVT